MLGNFRGRGDFIKHHALESDIFCSILYILFPLNSYRGVRDQMVRRAATNFLLSRVVSLSLISSTSRLTVRAPDSISIVYLAFSPIEETGTRGSAQKNINIKQMCDSLPFGGAGGSGFGKYHGKYSFDTFIHDKAVMERAYFPELEPRYSPWNSFNLKFIQLAYNFDYFGLALLLLGLKKTQFLYQ